MLKLWGYCAIVLGGLLVSPASALLMPAPVTVVRPSTLPSPVVVAGRPALAAAPRLAAVGVEDEQGSGYLWLPILAHRLLTFFALSKFLFILAAAVLVGLRHLIRRRS